jgi:hypothetical protein
MARSSCRAQARHPRFSIVRCGNDVDGQPARAMTAETIDALIAHNENCGTLAKALAFRYQNRWMRGGTPRLLLRLREGRAGEAGGLRVIDRVLQGESEILCLAMGASYDP